MIITGEGSFDNQSLFNKATGVVIKEAIRQKKKIVLIAGKADQAVIQKLGYNISIIDLSKHFASEEESILKFKCGLDMAATAITKSINSHNDFNSAA
jgi:Glycerate kinase